MVRIPTACKVRLTSWTTSWGAHCYKGDMRPGGAGGRVVCTQYVGGVVCLHLCSIYYGKAEQSPIENPVVPFTIDTVVVEYARTRYAYAPCWSHVVTQDITARTTPLRATDTYILMMMTDNSLCLDVVS